LHPQGVRRQTLALSGGLGAARLQVSFFCIAKRKKSKKRRPRFPAPFGGSLRCSTGQAAAELATLKQSSPNPPDHPPLLGGAQGIFRSKKAW